MSKSVEAETLRQWLSSGTPVTLLDIRAKEDQEQWSIPGSIQIDAYNDLKAGRPGARLLYHTLNQLLALGNDVLVLPGHASKPIAFDAVPLYGRLGDVAERLRDWLSSEDGFIERILKRIPPTPPNYTRIVELNEAGVLPEGDPTDLEAGANRCAVSS